MCHQENDKEEKKYLARCERMKKMTHKSPCRYDKHKEIQEIY